MGHVCLLSGRKVRGAGSSGSEKKGAAPCAGKGRFLYLTADTDRMLPRHPSTDRAQKSASGHPKALFKNGADEETRTLDVHLGKVVLYQLSYVRE